MKIEKWTYKRFIYDCNSFESGKMDRFNCTMWHGIKFIKDGRQFFQPNWNASVKPENNALVWIKKKKE